MRKVWKAILLGAAVMCLAGCSGSEELTSESKLINNDSEIESQEEETSIETKTRDGENEAWVDLGFDGEINVNACLELAENWWESSNYVYIPMRYPGKDEGEKAYCYSYWWTYRDIMEFEPPQEVEGLPEFFYEKEWGWSVLFRSSVTLGAFLNEEAQMDIDKQEKVIINGGEFLRVEGTVHAVNEETGEISKSQKYIAYYGLLVPQEEQIIYNKLARVDGIAPEIPAENAQTVFIMGDTSEAQDKFDYVCEVADAIMNSYRIKEK